MEPERAFDYLAWKRAGRPMGDDLASWESAHFDAVVPARSAHQLAVRQLRLAMHEMAKRGKAARTTTSPARGTAS